MARKTGVGVEVECKLESIHSFGKSGMVLGIQRYCLEESDGTSEGYEIDMIVCQWAHKFTESSAGVLNAGHRVGPAHMMGEDFMPYITVY
jgi:hypothetical protein